MKNLQMTQTFYNFEPHDAEKVPHRISDCGQLEFEFMRTVDEFHGIEAALANVIRMARGYITQKYGRFSWAMVTADELIDIDSVDLVEEKIYKKMLKHS
jgi:hypothetical protein